MMPALKRLARAGLMVLFILFITLPFVMILLEAFGSDWFGMKLLPAVWTLKWFGWAADTVDLGAVLVNTAVIAVLATLFSLLLSMPAAWAIARYRLADRFEPYVGLTFAPPWIATAQPGKLPANAVTRREMGDGLLQLNLGFEARLSEHVALLGEYGHWFPMNNDPGDFYAFVPTNVAGIALRFGRVRP